MAGARADSPADATIASAFESGTLTQGQQSLETALQASAPNDAAAEPRRYALAIIGFLRAGEKLGQSWHNFGLRNAGILSAVPFLRLPAGRTDPAGSKRVTYEEFRAVFSTFATDMQQAEAAFAALAEDPGKVPVRFGLVHLDYAGDGKPGDTEALWRTYAKINPQAGLTEKNAAHFQIDFDAGDVPWFRGYCHLLRAAAEVVLAYDESNQFEHTAHLFFSHPQTSFAFLEEAAKHDVPADFSFGPVMDVVAFLHLINYPLRDPAQLSAALADLAAVPDLSRESWRRIEAETDDDHEWLPNPRQHGAIPGVKVTQSMIDAWLKTLDEVDALLAGRKLLPYWRTGMGPKTGVNLHRVFTEPTPFDLLLWLQGTAAVPYLEDGTLTDGKIWSQVNSALGAQALGFALYFN